MKFCYLLFFIISIPLYAIEIDFKYSPVSNFIHHLNCVSNSIFCGEKFFHELWEKEFIQGKNDKRKIKEWHEIVSRYEESYEFFSSEKSLITWIQLNQLYFSDQLRIAALQANTLDEYFSNLDLVLTSEDKIKIQSIARYFYPRFEKWWNKHAYKKGDIVIDEMKKVEMRKTLILFENFFELDETITNGKVLFSFIYNPGTNKAGIPNISQAFPSYFSIEFYDDENSNKKIDVLVHELAHHYFAHANKEKVKEFLKLFKKDETLINVLAFNLLNETLATVLGNGIINKMMTASEEDWNAYLKQDLSFYYEPLIDRNAKAIYPWMSEWVLSNKTLFNGKFFKKYIASVEQEFKNDLSRPITYLRKITFFEDQKINENLNEFIFSKAWPSFLERIESNWKSKEIQNKIEDVNYMSRVFFIHTSNFDEFIKLNIISEENIKEIKKELKENKELVFSIQKSSVTIDFIIIASNSKQMKNLFTKLVSQEKVFQGILKN